MFIVVVNQPLQEDASALEVMLNAESFVSSKRDLSLINKY